MPQTGSRTGAANLALVLAVVAFVAIGGLIYWLEITAVPTQRSVVVEDVEEEPMELDVPIASVEQLRGEPGGYTALEVAIRNEIINSRLGDEAIWVGPEESPFLVKLVEDAVARAQEMEVGDAVNLRGELYAMSDSVLDAWAEGGAIEGEGDRAVASFAEYYFEAHQIEPGVGGGSGGSTGGSAGGAADSGAGDGA